MEFERGYDSRIVDETADLAKVFGKLVHEAPDLIRIADIQLNG